jgi:hypothetical protein
MKTLSLIRTKFTCAHCKTNEILSFGYTDGKIELCLEHAMAELNKPETEPSVLEKYLERISPKEKQ